MLASFRVCPDHVRSGADVRDLAVPALVATRAGARTGLRFPRACFSEQRAVVADPVERVLVDPRDFLRQVVARQVRLYGDPCAAEMPGQQPVTPSQPIE